MTKENPKRTLVISEDLPERVEKLIEKAEEEIE